MDLTVLEGITIMLIGQGHLFLLAKFALLIDCAMRNGVH